MNKELEELLIIGLVIFVGLKLLGNTSATAALKSQQSTDLGLANAAAGVINNAFDDWS